jgi:uncharacterized membrane protein
VFVNVIGFPVTSLVAEMFDTQKTFMCAVVTVICGVCGSVGLL